MELENKVDLLDENALLEKNKTVKIGKTTPKEVIMNLLSAVLFFTVVVFCNLFLDGELHYAQIFTWNLGILVVINWVCGLMITFCMRQSGISSAKLTKNYKEAEEEKNEAFKLITDFSHAQKVLNELIEKDFEDRKNELERTISKLVAFRMEDGKTWKIGDKLPKKTHPKIHALKHTLEHMTPPTISLAQLAQSEASYKSTGIYDIPNAPDHTGAKWFIVKGGSKIAWFAIGPVVLSILAGALVGGFTLGSVVTIIGTLAIMIFNGARAYATAYSQVSKRGVDRFKQIVRIIKNLNNNLQSEKGTL